MNEEPNYMNVLNDIAGCLGMLVEVDDNSKFLWRCYGPDAYSKIITPATTKDVSLSVVYSEVTGEIYEVTLNDEWAKEYSRWIHPQYIRAYYSECFERQVEPNRADIDLGIDYTDTDNLNEIWRDFEAVFRDATSATSIRYQYPDDSTEEGDEESENELVTLDMSRDELATLALAAHQKDMTINDFINEAVWIKLKEMEREGVIDSFADETVTKGAV